VLLGYTMTVICLLSNARQNTASSSGAKSSLLVITGMIYAAGA